MKKSLSLSILFIMSAVGACSNSPDLTVGQQIAKSLEGTWEGFGAFSLTFSGTTVVLGTNTFTLSDPDHVTIGGKTYAVYKADTSLHIFRAEGDNLFNVVGTSLEDLNQKFISQPDDFTTITATRKKS